MDELLSISTPNHPAHKEFIVVDQGTGEDYSCMIQGKYINGVFHIEKMITRPAQGEAKE